MTISSIGSLSKICIISVVFWEAPNCCSCFFFLKHVPRLNHWRGENQNKTTREKKKQLSTAVERNLTNDEDPKRRMDRVDMKTFSKTEGLESPILDRGHGHVRSR